MLNYVIATFYIQFLSLLRYQVLKLLCLFNYYLIIKPLVFSKGLFGLYLISKDLISIEFIYSHLM